MNITSPRFLKSFYRKEPITGVIITMGAVNAILGGVNEIGSLMLLGLLASSSAIAYRWWNRQQAATRFTSNSDQLYLPPAPEFNDYNNRDDW
jgi:hypothetical protein